MLTRPCAIASSGTQKASVQIGAAALDTMGFFEEDTV